MPELREPQRQLLVEGEEAAHVGKDDDAGGAVAPSGIAANAANRVPSSDSSTSLRWVTAAPAIGRTGGSESNGAHMLLLRVYAARNAGTSRT